MYRGYRPPSVTLGVSQLQPPSTTNEEILRALVAREKASVDVFRDTLRMGVFKNYTDLMEWFNMLLRMVKDKKQIHRIHMLSVDPQCDK